jgi:hypothetical protein
MLQAPRVETRRTIGLKGIGVGTDEPALWAQDLGIVHLIGMHLTLRSARRLAHENGTYTLLAAEHDKLGLGRKGAKLPSSRKMRRHRRKRPKHLRWTWPTPQCLKHPATDTHAGKPATTTRKQSSRTMPTTASPRPPRARTRSSTDSPLDFRQRNVAAPIAETRGRSVGAIREFVRGLEDLWKYGGFGQQASAFAGLCRWCPILVSRTRTARTLRRSLPYVCCPNGIHGADPSASGCRVA